MRPRPPPKTKESGEAALLTGQKGTLEHTQYLHGRLRAARAGAPCWAGPPSRVRAAGRTVSPRRGSARPTARGGVLAHGGGKGAARRRKAVVASLAGAAGCRRGVEEGAARAAHWQRHAASAAKASGAGRAVQGPRAGIVAEGARGQRAVARAQRGGEGGRAAPAPGRAGAAGARPGARVVPQAAKGGRAVAGAGRASNARANVIERRIGRAVPSRVVWGGGGAGAGSE